MNLGKPLLGVFAVLGNWPNWEGYFDLSRKGLKSSFVALLASLAPLWLVVYGVEAERARLAEAPITLPDAVPFILIAVLWLFSFPALAYLIGMIFEKMDRVRPWIITRNWTLLALASVAGGMFGLVGIDLVPLIVASGVGFAAYLGLMVADIRLAQKVVEFNWWSSALTGCGIVAVGLTFVQLALST
jgi:hypothetical protein